MGAGSGGIELGTTIKRALGWGGEHPDKQGLFDRIYEGGRKGEVHELMERACASMSRGDALGMLADRHLASISGPYPETFQDVVSLTGNADLDDDRIWVIAPPGTRGDWFRRDDSIDYHTYRWVGRPGSDDFPMLEVKWLPHPLHPYDNWCWEDPATGLRARNTGRGYTEEGVGPLRAVPPPSVEAIAKELGFPDWRALKPVLVTWWS